MAVRYITVTPITNLFQPATRAFGDLAIVGGCDADATGPKKTPIAITNPLSLSNPSNPAGANLPVDDPRIPLFPFEKLDYAESIFARAKVARPEIVWEIKEKGGSYSVREKRS